LAKYPARQSGAPASAALVFERFQQRQSLAEVVIELRITPEVVRALFEQWNLELVEAALRGPREPRTPHRREMTFASAETLQRLLAELPTNELTRISVARYRGEFMTHDREYADLVELGGFTTGPTEVAALAQRYGRGDFRVSAVSAVGDLRWEFIVLDIS